MSRYRFCTAYVTCSLVSYTPCADMLVYTRREQKSSPAPDPEPPALAVDAVEKLDAKYVQELEEYLGKYVQVRLGPVDESDRCS